MKSNFPEGGSVFFRNFMRLLKPGSEMKTRKFVMTCLAAALLPLTIFSCKQNTVAETDEAAEEVPPLYGFEPSEFEADTVEVKYGDTFSVLMMRMGMDASDAYALSELCDSVFDLRKIKAGNHLHAYYEVTDSTRDLRYAIYEQDKVNATVFQCSDSLAIWNVAKPVEHVRKYTDVTINSSLWNDMLAAGGSPELIMNLADIYQWSVNFFTLQKGDRFRTIYTQSMCDGELVGIDTVHFSLFDGNGYKQTAAVRFETAEGGNTFWDKGGESLKRMFLKAPLKYNRISSRFSYSRRHPVTGKVKPHTAVDYAAPTGTPVQAIGDGTVTKCGWDPTGGGNRIRIKHNMGYESSYMHLSKFASGIRVGSRVTQGQLIGYVGATGTATGPHLDFRIWENGRPIDPLKLDSPASDPLDTAYLREFNALYEKYMAEVAGYDAPDSLATASAVPSE